MIANSEKEYEFLKKEVSEIRLSIMQLIGLIVSIGGFAAAAARLDFLKANFNLFPVILISTALFIISLLFDIIWYKFRSHNKHVGYIQLLAQEVSHHPYKAITDSQKKTYLDSPPEFLKEDSPQNNIIAFEFVMSRFNNALFSNGIDRVLKSTGKAKFIFALPQELKHCFIQNEDYNNFDSEFFSSVVGPLYSVDKPENKILKHRICSFLNTLFPVRKFISSLIFLYSPVTGHKRAVDNRKIDPKYISNGWQFPRKILQVAFSLVLVLEVFLFIYLESNYDFDLSYIFHFSSLLSVANLILFYEWGRRYVIGLEEILSGNGSIDYYCWTLFIFRVQSLNFNGIVPAYFSRSFIRYFKSKLILNKLNNNTTNSIDSPCGCCNKNNNCRDIYNYIICEKCLDDYKNHLIKCTQFNNAKIIACHKHLNDAIKAELKNLTCNCGPTNAT